MDWDTLQKSARKNFNGACRVCRVCNGIVCAGEVPGMGGLGTGTSFTNNVKALADVKFNLRTIHAVNVPNLAVTLLGLSLELPVIAAPIGGISLNMRGAMSEADYVSAIVSGCAKAGVVAMTGDGPKPEIFAAGLAALENEKGRVIPVIKPREPKQIVLLAQQAAAAGALAFGMDIDAAALVNMTRAGQAVGPKSLSELKYIKQHTTIPFIVKGIMTGDEAEACYQAGVDAIVVSNHGGRALDHTPGTAEVLGEISQAVKGKVKIFVDGAIQTGADILKMLALGADAVLIGRFLAKAAVGGGSDGVAFALERLKNELQAAMILTGTADVKGVPPTIIRLSD
ncbi:isopentenyl diphosphate isomerase/L-lactate dehydrogenase-like FMN-dependent dehydrogenase [Sporomusaceae bacterium BoRhaA]|uniref:alpha-hydroxy-acid oxidizing protein n=1 Tax=Pelorhabdus rhamnosifermentans TaxID=2772457 RepID=UPI001C061749|nr:alpha-hydroxy-acid oxidizing protein [Pelorhabdus rhamnosifermentans]MBU2702829.1 isopentenyl diphosphate isomerase/L-lactate dehydrogenase-like FMN-dependent dehydrogenase [Pelorhabdus rhamnosifermentans]